MKTILFAGFLKSHQRDIGPVVTALKSNTAYQVLQTAGIHAEEIRDSDLLPSTNFEKDNSDGLNDFQDTESLLLNRLACNILGTTIVHNMRSRHAAELAFARSLIGKVQPDLMIIPEDSDLFRGRLWALVAQHSRIPCVVIWPTWYNLFASYPYQCRPLANQWLVFTESSKKRLTNSSSQIPKHAVTAVGSCYFSQLERISSKVINKKPVASCSNILFTMQTGDDTLFYVNELCKAVLGDSSISLSIKPHPNQSQIEIERVLQLVQRYKSVNIEIIADVNLFQMLESTDLLITLTSISAFEALFSGVPVALFRYPMTVEEFELAALQHPFKIIDNLTKLRQVIRQCKRPVNGLALQKTDAMLNHTFGIQGLNPTDKILSQLVCHLDLASR